MASFAHEVLTGQLDGPFDPGRGAHFARTALISDEEFAPHHEEDDPLLAEYFNVPIEQIGEKRTDMMMRAIGSESPPF